MATKRTKPRVNGKPDILATIRAQSNGNMPHKSLEAWGGTIVIKAIPAKTVFVDWEPEPDPMLATARQIKESVFHKDGKPVFADVEVAELAEMISGSPFGPWADVMEVMGELNGTSERARKRMQESFTQADGVAPSSR